MRAIPRYVLVEYLKVFLVTLSSLTTLVMVFFVVKEAADMGLGPTHVARMVPFILPQALVYAIPGSALFAATLVYGRMSGLNEIVALKSLGISPMTILWPVFVLAFLLSLTSVWLNDVAVSWGFHNFQRVGIEAFDDIVYSVLRTKKSFGSPGGSFTINVRDVDDRKLLSPTIVILPKGDAQPTTVRAEEAEIAVDSEANTLVFSCTNSTTNVGDQVAVHNRDRIVVAFSLAEAAGKADKSGHAAHMPLVDIPPEIKKQRLRIEQIEQEMAARAAFSLVTGDFETATEKQWALDLEFLKMNREQLSRLGTESPRRWAQGFSCLFFVLIGAPMAINMRRVEVLATFFMCFSPILILYYPLLAYGIGRAKDGSLPGYSVWLGNVILAVWGVWLLRKVIRF